jgi:hypothetical protein
LFFFFFVIQNFMFSLPALFFSKETRTTSFERSRFILVDYLLDFY